VQACPTSALQEHSIVELGMPTRSVETTCAYCGVGCSFRAEVQGDGADSRVVRWCRPRTAAPTRATAASRAASPTGTPRTRTAAPGPMVRDSLDDEWRAGLWEEAIAKVATGFQGAPGEHGSGHRRISSSAAPTRRSTSSRRWCGRRSATTTSTRARGSATRPRATAQADLRHLGRHPGLPLGGEGRRDPADRRQPDRRPPVFASR
jgi:anaerobic selenocysteine-containing dehydrogenase